MQPILQLLNHINLVIDTIHMFQKILLPINKTHEAIETTAKALELAKIHESQLILLSVLPSINADINQSKAIGALINQIHEKIQKAGFSCDVIEKTGKPAFVICDVADELNIDVIVMCTKGIMIKEDTESTASRVIQLAPCPVLVIP